MVDKKEITEFKICMPYGWGFYNNFRFIHVRPAKNDKRRMICVGRENFSCREFFIRQMRAKFTGEWGYWGNGKDIESSRTYVGVAFERFQDIHKLDGGLKRLKIRMEKSLAILNALELECGWPRTKMFPLRPANDKNIVPGYLFIGDKKWNRSPYLMSLYTLIIRMGHWNWVPAKVSGKNWDQVNSIIRKAAGKMYTDQDKQFVRESLDSWPLLLRNYKHLFGYKDRAYQWSSARLSHPGYSTTEGIHKLVTGGTYHERLLSKFRKLKKGIASNEKGKDKKGKSRTT